ncbi:MAG: acyclic terpene utilization AtuA family protein, partial [Actinomycetota bacterium]
VEMSEDGSFVVTKHDGTGGLINVATVTEQLVYEMGDPGAYLTPDVVVDFGSIQLEQVGPDRVRVSGIRGAAPTDLLKVSLSYSDGYKSSGGVVVCGPDASAKAEAFGEILWKRLPEYEATLTEAVGASATWGPLSPSQEANEVIARFGVRDQDRSKIQEFSKMVPAMVLSGPPGVGVFGGRPPVQDVVAYWPCLIPRDLCQAEVTVIGGGDRVEATVPFEGQTGIGRVESADSSDNREVATTLSGETVTVKLAALAHGRSGDKGDTCNIGVIARHPDLYPWLVEHLTAKRVQEAFTGIAFGDVERFEVPNIDAVNFLLHECLGGGGTLSLHIDAQGKTYSHALLNIDVEIDRALAALVGAA